MQLEKVCDYSYKDLAQANILLSMLAKTFKIKLSSYWRDNKIGISPQDWTRFVADIKSIVKMLNKSIGAELAAQAGLSKNPQNFHLIQLHIEMAFRRLEPICKPSSPKFYSFLRSLK